MDFLFFLKSLAAVLETVFLILAIYSFFRGIKTKEYGKAGLYISVYLFLIVIRIIAGY